MDSTLMTKLKVFVSAILAGISISLGGMIFLSVESKVLGSLLFAVGLFLVLTFGFSLFTGKVCYTLGSGWGYVLDLLIIWLGNFCGTCIVAFLIRASRIAGIAEKASAMCDTKMQDNFISLFVLGIFCNIFIYIAVDEYKNNPHEFGKYLAIIFGVMGFILCGTEHCVADMFYFNLSKPFSLDILLRLLVITIGNAVGGIGINSIVNVIRKK